MPEHSSKVFTIDEDSKLPAVLGPPKQIACYSTTATGVEFNTASLRYFVVPPLHANLYDGGREFMRRYRHVVHQPQRLDSILFACLQSAAKECLSTADIVIRRGVLVKIMCRVNVELNVSIIDGVLYIEEYQSKQRREYFDTYYPGYSFEKLCTTSSLDLEGEHSIKSIIDPDIHWLSVINRKLGELNIIMACEVDCIKGQYTGQPDTFLELKSKKIVEDDRNLTAWYKKSYMQSHLTGISELFVGYHSNDILRRTEMLCIADIPSKILSNGQPWNPQKELDRGYATLTAIRKSCSEQLAKCSSDGITDDKVWRVNVLRKGIYIRELAADSLAFAISDREERIGIVPLKVIKELRST